jgi:hypothetical protein
MVSVVSGFLCPNGHGRIVPFDETNRMYAGDTLTQEDAAVQCMACKGTGLVDCDECDGIGKVKCNCGYQHECDVCDGTGEAEYDQCEYNKLP